MRIAVISDIHANLEALRTVLGRIHALKADAIVCLGDIVGYNANPNECVDIVRKEGIACVSGNHDVAAAGLEEPDNFNPAAKAALYWTREQLAEENRDYLARLKREQGFGSSFLFHGSIHNTNRYILTRDDAQYNFRMLQELPDRPAAGLFGHTHISAWLSEQGGVIIAAAGDGTVDLAADRRYLFNPGGVGQPRDGDNRAAFLLFDEEARKVTFHRIEYDIRTCQDKILRAGLPPFLAERLEWGR